MTNILHEWRDQLQDEEFIAEYSKYDALDLQVELGNWHGHDDELTFKQSLELSSKIKDIASNLNAGYDIIDAQDSSCQTYDKQPMDIGLLPSDRN